MEKKYIVNDRGSFIVRVDYELWSRVSTFVKAKYEKYSVEISKDDDVELFKDLDAAYEYICQHTDSIKRLKLVAKNKENVLNLSIKNYRDITNINNVELYAECTNFDSENGVRLNIMEMLEDHKLYGGIYRIAGIIYVIGIFKCMSDKMTQNIYITYPLLTSLLIALVIMAVMFLAVIPLIQRIIFGRKKIHFLTNYENIEKYKRKKTWDTIISISLLAGSVVLAVMCSIF